MSHWTFVIASYALTLGGAIGLAAWSWMTMHRAERDAADLSRRHEA